MNTTTYPHFAQSRRPSFRPASRMLLVYACACLVFNTGCTSLRTLEVQPQRGAQQDVKLNEEATLLLHDGRTLEVTVVELTNAALIGRDATGTRHSVDWRDIAAIQVTRISVLRSTLLAGVITAAAVAFIAQSYEPSFRR